MKLIWFWRSGQKTRECSSDLIRVKKTECVWCVCVCVGVCLSACVSNLSSTLTELQALTTRVKHQNLTFIVDTFWIRSDWHSIEEIIIQCKCFLHYGKARLCWILLGQSCILRQKYKNVKMQMLLALWIRLCWTSIWQSCTFRQQSHMFFYFRRETMHSIRQAQWEVKS